MWDNLDLTIPNPQPGDLPDAQDMLGNTIVPGDICVFGITAGRSGSLTIGLVKRLKQGPTFGAYYPNWKPVPKVTFMALIDSGNRYSRESTRHSNTTVDKALKLDTTLEKLEAHLEAHPYNG